MTGARAFTTETRRALSFTENNMKIKVTSILVLCACLAYGQRDSLRSNKFCIEIPPLSYIDVYSLPTYQVTAEMGLYRNFSLCIEGGGYFGINGSGVFSSAGRISDVKGYMAKAEIKIYTNAKHISNGSYISLEGVYKKQSFNWQDSIHLTPPYLTTFRDYKNIYCLNIKIGRSEIDKSGIIFDEYFGLGVRFRNVNSTLTPQQVGALKYDDDSNYDSGLTGQEVIPGKNVYPNIVLGFKIGYCIR